MVKKTREAHPFHIHQVHFLFYAKNKVRQLEPEWRPAANRRKQRERNAVDCEFFEPTINSASLGFDPRAVTTGCQPRLDCVSVAQS
jgi:hypothetical protein